VCYDSERKETRICQSKAAATDHWSVSYKFWGNFSKDNSKVDFWCTFCKGNHKSVSCGLVTERSILRRKVDNCQSERKCYLCGAKHHTSICTAQIQKQRPPAFLKQEETPKGNRTVSTNLYFTRNMSNEHILLQTARAKVHSPRSDSSSQS
jgi:hypothetical protein